MFKNKQTSIKFLNYTFFLSIIYFNIIFYTVDGLRNLQGFFLSINLYLIFLYYLFNKKYENESIVGQDDIKKLIKTDFLDKNSSKKLLSKKMKYKENEETYKLFKNMFIRKNLVTKDYLDLKKVFLKFVPESSLREVGNSGFEKISLGISVKKQLNVVFLDIIGFTSITEKLPQERALFLLNVYFDGIVNIVKTYGGYIDKFLGDGMMMIFEDKNSDSTIKAAIEIQNFISKFQISEIGRKISVGIGINYGEVILGTIGSKNRMEITIIGDTVNTASRIEGLTRTYKDNIIVSDSVIKNLSCKDDFIINEIGYKTLKGKKGKIKIYGVENLVNLKI